MIVSKFVLRYYMLKRLSAFEKILHNFHFQKILDLFHYSGTAKVALIRLFTIITSFYSFFTASIQLRQLPFYAKKWPCSLFCSSFYSLIMLKNGQLNTKILQLTAVNSPTREMIVCLCIVPQRQLNLKSLCICESFIVQYLSQL